MGTNVLALAPRRCVIIRGNPLTRAALERAGATVIEYEGTEISVKGAGGPTCLTRPDRASNPEAAIVTPHVRFRSDSRFTIHVDPTGRYTGAGDPFCRGARRRRHGRPDRRPFRQRWRPRAAARCHARRSGRRAASAARTLKPDPFFTAGHADADHDRRVRRRTCRALPTPTGSSRRSSSRLDVKRDLLARVDAVRRAGSIVSSNTSGIPIALLAEGRSDDFRRHWLGTHFFNPPRYLHLLEVIPTAETDPGVVDAVSAFADRHLGKGVVIAKDTPNFIGNHLALYGVMRMLEKVAAGDYTHRGGRRDHRARDRPPEERDVPHARSCRRGHPRPRRSQPARAARTTRTPRRVRAAAVRGADAGARAGSARRPDRASTSGSRTRRRVRDPDARSGDARVPPAAAAQAPFARRGAQSIDDVGERVRTLFEGNDRVGQFLRDTLARRSLYTAAVDAGRSRTRRTTSTA